jgi:hypothetical protein
MATGRKTVVVGQVIDPNTWGNPLWDQSVQTFASAADRAAQFPVPLQGATTWLEDDKRLDVYNGTAWTPVVSELATANLGSGIVPFSPDFAAGQLARLGQLVTFYGAVTFPSGVISGAPVWAFPDASWVPAAGKGAHLIGWLGGEPARFQVMHDGSITYQAGGAPSTPGVFAFCQGSWVIE